jgi:hypothetical protein
MLSEAVPETFSVLLEVHALSESVDTVRTGAVVSANVAVQVTFASGIVTLNGLVEPEQPPDQPINVEPESAEAVIWLLEP